MFDLNIIKTNDSVSVTCVVDGKVSIASIDNLHDGRWWISRVNVQGVEKGKGLGSKLLKKAMEEVFSFSPKEIIVTPGGYNADIKRQVNFYKKNGFKTLVKDGLMSYKVKKTDYIIITDHAYLRAKERLSLNKKSIDRLASSAFKSGIKQSDTKGQLKKYIDNLWFEYKTANNIRIYGEIIYFFSNNRLITLYQIPNEFKKTLKHFK